MRELTIGSLFDGSGGFPLAAALEGIRSVWASEVEPYPIAVTRSRFPDMKHYGDVSKINGADIEPVDIITFGSPCQDLSVAGKRAGLKHEAKGDEETTRSGLFLEAIRIIKEMREATHGVYPTYAIWENVTGAFSSGKGEDFRTVLNEFVNIVEPGAEVPPPPQGRWPYADILMGDGWSVAYRTFDACKWGVPQRRRRIYLVADFRGERAGKILFKRAGLRGHNAPRREAREGAAADLANGSGAADSESVRGVGINGDVAGTLDASYYKGCEMRQGVEREVVVFDAYQHHGWRENTTTGALATANASNVRGDTPLVVLPIHDKATRHAGRRGEKHDHAVAYGIDRAAFNQGENAKYEPKIEEEMSATIVARGPNAVAYAPIVGGLNAGDYKGANRQYVEENKLVAEEDKVEQRYIVRRLTPTECCRLQGFFDGWGEIDHKEDFTDEEFAFWLDVRNTHGRINGKALRHYTKAQMVTWYNKLHTDSAEYKMWGNGIALPCALYVMQGIVEAVKEDEENV